MVLRSISGEPHWRWWIWPSLAEAAPVPATATGVGGSAASIKGMRRRLLRPRAGSVLLDPPPFPLPLTPVLSACTSLGLSRGGKSCRFRWMSYLKPKIKRGRFSFEEEEIIIQLHQILGNRWSAIAARLPGRTDTEIKNYWNYHTSKRIQLINPATHGSLLANTPDNPLLMPSLFNPTQLLVSHLIGLKSLLSLKMLTMANNIIPSNANQNIVEQQMNSSCVEGWPEMIPREVNADQLLNLVTQRQDDMNWDFEVQAIPAQMEDSSIFSRANDQSSLGSDNLNLPSTYFDGSIEDIIRAPTSFSILQLTSTNSASKHKRFLEGIGC